MPATDRSQQGIELDVPWCFTDDHRSWRTVLRNTGQEVKQTVANNQPVYKTNQFAGKAGIRMDGNGDHFFVNGALRTATGPVTAFVVSKRDADGGDGDA